jgi:predicted transcriptional regulator
MSDSIQQPLVLAAQIAVSYLETHSVDASAVPGLIRDIYKTLESLSHNGQAATEPAGSGQRPAVNPHRSVFPDHLVCLEDGEKVTTLKRHLRTAHGLTPEQYRAKWGLPTHYPMVAPNYAKLRSKMAKESGLGRHRK